MTWTMWDKLGAILHGHPKFWHDFLLKFCFENISAKHDTSRCSWYFRDVYFKRTTVRLKYNLEELPLNVDQWIPKNVQRDVNLQQWQKGAFFVIFARTFVRQKDWIKTFLLIKLHDCEITKSRFNCAGGKIHTVVWKFYFKAICGSRYVKP